MQCRICGKHVFECNCNEINMEWISPKDELPPQGKKILYFKKGDIYVVQRFGKYWLPIPFFDSEFSLLEEPKFWCDIIPPSPYLGKMKVIVNDISYDIDGLEKAHPEVYEDLVKNQLRLWRIKED